jgi:hypothetical protein
VDTSNTTDEREAVAELLTACFQSDPTAKTLCWLLAEQMVLQYGGIQIGGWL